jgi:hypothetical protein
MCVKNGTPALSHQRTVPPRTPVLSKLSPGDQELALKCPTTLQHLLPTCLMTVIAWEGSSQGKLFLGPSTAELTAANVHPGSALDPVTLEFKTDSFQSSRLSFSSLYKYVTKPGFQKLIYQFSTCI